MSKIKIEEQIKEFLPGSLKIISCLKNLHSGILSRRDAFGIDAFSFMTAIVLEAEKWTIIPTGKMCITRFPSV